MQENSPGVQGGAGQDFQQDARVGPPRAAACAKDVPQGLVLVLGNVSASPGSGCGAGVTLLSLRGGRDQPHTPRHAVVCENPHFPLPESSSTAEIKSSRDPKGPRDPKGS